MKKEFITLRQGKEFVLYAGLLDAAHGDGLDSIETQLLQAPAETNDWTAIVQAEVRFLRPNDHSVRFTGIGDANRHNVSSLMRPHIVRMAETRAKARALRDALNIGAAALEELGGEDPDPSQARISREQWQKYCAACDLLEARGVPREDLPLGDDQMTVAEYKEIGARLNAIKRSLKKEA